jgi:hypothetical protein
MRAASLELASHFFRQATYFAHMNQAAVSNRSRNKVLLDEALAGPAVTLSLVDFQKMVLVGLESLRRRDSHVRRRADKQIEDA